MYVNVKEWNKLRNCMPHCITNLIYLYSDRNLYRVFSTIGNWNNNAFTKHFIAVNCHQSQQIILYKLKSSKQTRGKMPML